MKAVKREDVHPAYKELLEREAHHDHEIILDDHDVIRWKKNDDVDKMLERISLNDLAVLLQVLGYGKESEVYRKLYRSMGYSLSGYWDIFYSSDEF